MQKFSFQPARSFILEAFRLLGASALDVLSPPRCLVCAASLCDEYGEAKESPFRSVCMRCFDNIPPAPSPEEIALKIQRNFDADDIAIRRFIARFQRNKDLDFHEDNQETPIEPILYAMKYGDRQNLCRDGGRELGRHMCAHAFERYAAVIPVPIHAARRRERGYNQAERIAESVAEILGAPYRADVLRRVRYTPSQTLLTKTERARSVQDAFRVLPRQARVIRGAGTLLVDDILTSGATLNACATALLHAGARFVDAAAIFRA